MKRVSLIFPVLAMLLLSGCSFIKIPVPVRFAIDVPFVLEDAITGPSFESPILFGLIVVPPVEIENAVKNAGLPETVKLKNLKNFEVEVSTTRPVTFNSVDFTVYASFNGYIDGSDNVLITGTMNPGDNGFIVGNDNAVLGAFEVFYASDDPSANLYVSIRHNYIGFEQIQGTITITGTAEFGF